MTEKSESTEMLDRYCAVIRELCDAVAAHDTDHMLRYFDDSCVFVNGVDGRHTAKDGLVEFFQQVWESFPDYAPVPVEMHLNGDVLAVIFRTTATVRVGESEQIVSWLMTSFSTFDPETVTIVRDVYFADEEALEETIQRLHEAATVQ
ncbi:nuclear transport factor 2 family protein [Rhodococcus opacus]|uniref:SnoaL-like domain-containing protein n=1 Tax=Rhodococcus opacus (strain B4) TaxID=632772 RepID=C1ASA3_RHOOB|nr:nuclear transport factor 2 family protein [Rhodococcus opacus]BAH48352.1 hypothetical protein ROP_01050 [Rhodococcus opacus B4]